MRKYGIYDLILSTYNNYHAFSKRTIRYVAKILTPLFWHYFQVKSLWPRPCWQPLHLTSKNKCWENVCSLLSNRCIKNWPAKLPVCYWRLTTQNWCICWNTKNHLRVSNFKLNYVVAILFCFFILAT